MTSFIQSPIFSNQVYRRPYHQLDPVPNIAGILSAMPPGVQSLQGLDWWPARKWAQDFGLSNTSTQGIPPPLGYSAQIRAPLFVNQTYRRPHLQVDPQPNNLGALLVAVAPPFQPPLFPETVRTNTRDFQVHEGLVYLSGPVIAPYIPVEFPTPMRAREKPQDFFFQTTDIPPAEPFYQLDWPLYLRARHPHQDFEWSGKTTQGIPAGVQEPFHQDDWPDPRRARNQYSEPEPSPQILLVTPIIPPPTAHAPYSDWPTPLRAKITPQDHIWSGVTTRGIAPALTGILPAPHLDACEPGVGQILLLWSAVVGAFGYHIYVNGVAQPTLYSQRVVVISGLQLNTPYAFNVTGVNSIGVDTTPLSNTILYEHASTEFINIQPLPWDDAGTLN